VTKLKRKSYKGHCLLCAWSKGKVHGSGSDRVPWSVKRRLGRKRRLGAVSEGAQL